jgi:NADPH-dependent 2,4-dienoyl-CoA reductase/sulfur reductase-like enzyme
MATGQSHIDLPSSRLPVVARPDVLVVGGGSAGLSAAVAAARNGADVLLLERFSYL